jgi:hypothetical protein
MNPPSWPFAVWGLDILGPFPRVVGGYRYLYVAIDKFTKWPEVTPVVNITKASATAFLRSIVCRFGVPNRVITDNKLVRARERGRERERQLGSFLTMTRCSEEGQSTAGGSGTAARRRAGARAAMAARR